MISESSCFSRLWFNEDWSKEFARFLVKLTEGIDRQRIKIIEVHPPIDNYFTLRALQNHHNRHTGEDRYPENH